MRQVIAAILGGLSFLFLSPVVRSETPPAPCSGSPVYRFILEGSTNGGSTWSETPSTYSMYAGTYVDVQLRTKMTITSGQTSGWSFGVNHSSSWTQYYGGSVSIQSVTTAGTNTATVQNGSPPDVNHTQIRSGFKGWTQGIVINTGTGGAVTLGPTSNFVQAKATYRITAPLHNGTYDVVCSFSHDIGNPRIRTIVAQSSTGYVPCANTLTFRITVSGGSGLMGGALLVAPGQQGGVEFAPGAVSSNKCFSRGDANNDGQMNLTDIIFTLNFFFQGGPVPPCQDAADTNDDGKQDVSDPIHLLNYLFFGTAGPPASPTFPDCGPDPAPLDLINCLDSLCDSPDTPDGDRLTNCDESERGTDPDISDTDGDNFADGEEVLKDGVPIPGTMPTQYTDIAALGASPLKPDIFVEVDWYQLTASGNKDHSHRPTLAQLDKVGKSFANAPITRVVNGETITGMTLHIDAGSGALVNLPTTSNNGTPIKFTNNDAKEEFMSTATIAINAKNNECDLTNMWNDFETIRSNNFKSNQNVFHYCLYVHRIHNFKDLTIGVDFTGSTGQAQGIFTDDFILASNRPGIQQELNYPDAEFQFWQSAIFMHELGHTFGLDHGGATFLPQFKPNYRSIMSLHYAKFGADRNCNAMSDAGDDNPGTLEFDERLDYSREVLDCLNEIDLDETKGICIKGGSCVGPPGSTCVGINWDEDEFNKLTTGVQKDITNDFNSTCSSVLVEGHDDWNGGTLKLDFQNAGDNRVTPPTTCASCTKDDCLLPLGSGSPRSASFCPTVSELKKL